MKTKASKEGKDKKNNLFKTFIQVSIIFFGLFATASRVVCPPLSEFLGNFYNKFPFISVLIVLVYQFAMFISIAGILGVSKK